MKLFLHIHALLTGIEERVLEDTIRALKKNDPKPDAGMCDKIFGGYSRYLLLCKDRGCASRAAWFGRERLIPAVLATEKQVSTKFHKGALFYDTGLAQLLAGNEDGFEYLLAMVDEEEFRKTGGTHKRGTSNLKSGQLEAQTIAARVQFACDLLNGKIAGHPANLAFMTGMGHFTASLFNSWRGTLHPLHQFELLRIIHDVEVFLGVGYSDYPAVADNPFVMLRLAKALSHLSQWIESCLTHWQGGKVTKMRKGRVLTVNTLGDKLKYDSDFVKLGSNADGGCENFPGACPEGARAINIELRKLLTDLAGLPAGTQRHWRLLRILYIVRNSTAHTIEEGLDVYNDRCLLLNLLQVVFVSVLVIRQLKKPMPCVR
jgi:hypothetical protein